MPRVSDQHRCFMQLLQCVPQLYLQPWFHRTRRRYVYGLFRRNLQNHNRLGRLYQLWRRHVLDNNSRHGCGDMPRVSDQHRCFMQWLQCVPQLYLQPWFHRPRRRYVHDLYRRKIQDHIRYCRMHHMPYQFHLADRELSTGCLHLQRRIHRPRRRHVHSLCHWSLQNHNRLGRLYQL